MYTKMISIQAELICQEDVALEEAKLFLEFLQELSRAMMGQLAVVNRYRIFYKNSIRGLEKDLEENNREIDRVQNYIKNFLKYKSN